MTISMSKARKILGSKYKDMSDPDVQVLLNQFYDLAEIIAENISGSKLSTMGIESSSRKEQNEAR